MFYTGKKAAFGDHEGVIGTKCDSGSVAVPGRPVRVIGVSKGFCRGGVRGQVRHAVGTCKAVLEDKEEVIGDRERVTRNRQGL